ncbi:MAG TPA: SdrD B-like domain-containing protein [Gemmatimonadales bacterium]|nr:SdrD B-like domain-containing protein [Gemmatimonadales bacterium]
MRRFSSLTGAALVAAACSNAGAGRVLTITGVGRVVGQAYFDVNGNRALDAGDTPFQGVGIRLIAAGTVDTVARATTNGAGTFTFTGVTAGSYTLAVDTAGVAGDTVRVTRVDTSAFTISPGDTEQVTIAIGYPEYSIRAARALPLGTRAFIVGVALSGTVNGASGQTGIFGDSTVNIADTSGAARVVGLRNAVVGIGDSNRYLVRVQRDPIDNTLRAFAFGSLSLIGLPGGALTPVDTMTAAQAAGANGGQADAALVTIVDTVVVQDTATILGLHGPYRRMHVVDAVAPAGALEVRLDSLAGFVPSAMLKDTVNAKVVLSGLLVPTGVAGVWTLKPRAPGDQH